MSYIRICWKNKWMIPNISSNSKNLSDFVWIITKVPSNFKIRQFYIHLFHTQIFLSNYVTCLQ